MSMEGMSTVWMRMPGQTWLGAAAAFLAMWVTMMAAMMLPSLASALRRYHQTIARDGGAHAARDTATATAAYFAVWAVIGLAVFAVGAALATAVMHDPLVSRATPFAAGVVVLLAGSLQFTKWKARRLACCARTHTRGTAWQHGLTLGAHCALCCAGPMAVLLAVGVMDLRAMAIVTVAITAERLAKSGVRIARMTGAVALGAGVLMIARATGLA
jgi:predicted metal-binding membrane protein